MKQTKINLEEIMRKIKKYKQKEGDISNLCGFGLFNFEKYKPNFEEQTNYTDNSLAGNWFNYGTETEIIPIIKPKYNIMK